MPQTRVNPRLWRRESEALRRAKVNAPPLTLSAHFLLRRKTFRWLTLKGSAPAASERRYNALHNTNDPLCFGMPTEFATIDAEDLKSRMRELGRFL